MRVGAAVLSWALALSLVVSGGCTRASEISAERAQRSIAAGDPRILVVPLNTSIQLAAGLEAAVEPVQQEILQQLDADGARVSFLAVEDARGLWSETVRTLRSQQRNTASLEVTAGTFVRSLRREVGFDLLLMPTLGYRQARVERGYARWDGVQRSLTPRQREAALREKVPAYSLHAQVYTPDGRLWSQHWGGLDVVEESDLQSEPALTPDQVERSSAAIREGVALALSR